MVGAIALLSGKISDNLLRDNLLRVGSYHALQQLSLTLGWSHSILIVVNTLNIITFLVSTFDNDLEPRNWGHDENLQLSRLYR